MTEPICITTVNRLPAGVNLYGPMSEAEYLKCTAPGRAYKLTRSSPRTYVEYFVEVKKEAENVAPIE